MNHEFEPSDRIEMHPNSNPESHVDMDEENDAIAQLLRTAGRRAAPSEVVTQQTYNLVHAAWVFEQRGRSRMRFAALAAGLTAIAAVGWWLVYPQFQSTPLAEVVQTQGDVLRLHGDRPVSVLQKETVVVGDELIANSNSRAVLQRVSGINIVLGAQTHVRWDTRDSLRLLSGILYVDTGTRAASDPFSIVTEAGVIHHVGTQFAVLARDAAVRVEVREGSVYLQAANRATTVAHGEQAILHRDGELVRSRLSDVAGAWNWLSSDTPQFVIEDRSLFAVLDDISQASGLHVSYGSAAVELQAKQLKLHGAALTLEPAAALNAVLATTQFEVARTAREIVINAR